MSLEEALLLLDNLLLLLVTDRLFCNSLELMILIEDI